MGGCEGKGKAEAGRVDVVEKLLGRGEADVIVWMGRRFCVRRVAHWGLLVLAGCRLWGSGKRGELGTSFAGQ